MGRRKVPRTLTMLPNSPTWHVDVSKCFWAHLAPFWLQDEETFLGSMLSPSPLALPSASGAHSSMALSFIMSCLIFSGAVGVAAVFSSLSRCGAARGSPSSLQLCSSQAFHTCLSSAGPLSKKSERGISYAKHLLAILQCPPKIKPQSRASVSPTCLISSCSSFLIPSLTPKQTFCSSEALGSTDHSL